MGFIAFALLALRAGLLYLEAREAAPGGRKALLKFEALLRENFSKLLGHIKNKF